MLKTRLVAVLALMIGTLFACGGDDSPVADATAADATGTNATPDDGGAPTPTGEPIKIGVPLPTTGPLALGGQQQIEGIEFAVAEANAGGGLLGRPIELLIEDTKGEANAAATVATKLVNRERVDALVGGVGSTPDFAMLQSIQGQGPLFIHTGSQASALEESFGAEDWYFHIFTWDYHRQKALKAFLDDLDPPAQTFGIAYEDSLFGTDAAKQAREYLGADYDIVVDQSFKSGSPDFSPILNRVSSAEPDVFFFIGTSADIIQATKQVKELDTPMGLFLTVHNGQQPSDLGEPGIDVAVMDVWSPDLVIDGLPEWNRRYEEVTGHPPVIGNAQGYTGMQVLIDAVEAAGSIEKAAVIERLEQTEFWTPFGQLSFQASDKGGRHQLLTEDAVIVTQYTADGGNPVVWPAEKASAELVYPAGD